MSTSFRWRVYAARQRPGDVNVPSIGEIDEEALFSAEDEAVRYEIEDALRLAKPSYAESTKKERPQQGDWGLVLWGLTTGWGTAGVVKQIHWGQDCSYPRISQLSVPSTIQRLRR